MTDEPVEAARLAVAAGEYDEAFRLLAPLVERVLSPAGWEKSAERLAPLLGPIARQGVPTAQFVLGRMFCKGRGVPKDLAEGFRLCRAAAEQGLAEAQEEVGLMYQFGYGASEDGGEAARWFMKTAEQGSLSAMMFLGDLYLSGPGSIRDPVKAEDWFLRAARKGSYLAQARLGQICEGRKDYASAYRWYDMAAESYPDNVTWARDRAERVRRLMEQGDTGSIP